MKASSMRTDHLLPGAPSMAPDVGFWERRRALRAGKHSARMTAPDVEGYHPATRAMAAEIAQVEARIHTALIKAVEALDRSIAPAEAQLRLLTARLPSESSWDTPEAAAHMSASEQDVLRSREAANQRTSVQRADVLRQLDELQKQVAQLSQQREHLHSTAAGVLTSWVARFDKLVAHHREGFIRALTRRFPSPVLTIKEPANLPMPYYRPAHPWVDGTQIPVTITEIHPEQQPTLRWAHLPWNL